MERIAVWAGLALCAVTSAPLPAQSSADSTWMVERTMAELWSLADRNGADLSRLAGHPRGAPASFCISASEGYSTARLDLLRDAVIERSALPLATCVSARQQMTDTTRTERGYFDTEGRPTNYVIIDGPAVPTNDAYGAFYVRLGLMADGLWGWGVACGFDRDIETREWVVTSCSEWVS